MAQPTLKSIKHVIDWAVTTSVAGISPANDINADKLDGCHVGIAANDILKLDANAKISAQHLYTGHSAGLSTHIDADKLDGKHYADLKNEWESYANSAGGDIPLPSDVTGTHPGPYTVARIQGRAVSTSAPTIGQTMVWDGTNWTPSSPAGTMTASYVLTYNGSSGNRHTYSMSIPSNGKFCPVIQAAKLNADFPSASFRIVMGSGESLGMACYSSLAAAQADPDGASGVSLSHDASTGAYYYGSALAAVNFYSSNARDYELFASAHSGMTIPIRLVKM